MSLSSNCTNKINANKLKKLLQATTLPTISTIIGYPGQVNKMCSNNFIRNRITARKENTLTKNYRWADRQMDG